MLTKRSVWRGGSLWVLCGFVAACLSAAVTQGQDSEDLGTRVEKRRQAVQKKAVRAMERLERELQGGEQADPRPSDDADLGEAARHLNIEIEILKTRLEIAQSELRLLEAKARLKLLERNQISPEDQPRGAAERGRDPLRGRLMREPRGRFLPGGGPGDRPEGRSDDRRGRGRPDARENSREERRESREDDEAVEGALNQPLVIPFPDPTSLEEVVKFLKKVSQSPSLPSGLSFYVDPEGLERARTSMEAKVHLKSDELPLRESLKRILSQVGLVFEVKDGLVTITSKPMEEESEDEEPEPDSE